MAVADRYLEPLEHEELVVRRGRRSGLYTIVAVHSTVRGPSLGGCRMWGYGDARAAVRDALRLSRAMTEHALRCRAHDIVACPRFSQHVADLTDGRTPTARIADWE